VPHEACLGSSSYCRIGCRCGVRPGASPARRTTPFHAARRHSRRSCSAGYAPSRCAASALGATRSEQARLAVERSGSQSIEPPGAEPHLKRKSARLRTVRRNGAYLCAATPMVRATVAVSLAVPADAVVSATDVVPATRVVVDSPLEGVACELTIPQFLGLSASTRRISPSRRAARLPTGDFDDASPNQAPKWVLAQIGQKKPAPPNRRHRRGCGWQTRYRETLPHRTTNARKSERPAKLARSE
jgi:hypothetical protein